MRLVFFLLTLPTLAMLSGCATLSPLAIEWKPTERKFGEEGPFVLPQIGADYPIWGMRNGLVLGIPPARVGLGREGVGGPRGLFRIGYEQDGALYFINFMAINPITTGGEIGWSELDGSPTDYKQGIRMFAYPVAFHDDWQNWKQEEPPSWPEAATVRRNENGEEELAIVVRYETFRTGAKPYFVIVFNAERPNEIAFYPFAEPDGEPLINLVLSGTWGNITRLRDLYLRDRIVNARQLWPHYRGTGFAQRKLFALAELARNREGDVVFAARPDEKTPWDEPGYPHKRVLTQYWRKPRGTFDDSLQGLVNGRYTFWKSSYPVPNGITFENVGIMENFRPGSVQIFGISDSDPYRLFR